MEDKIFIRKVIEKDLPEISSLIIENADFTLAKYYTEEQLLIFKKYYSIEILKEKLKTQDIYCAEYQQEIIGTIALAENFVIGFYTKVKFLHQGVGKKLMFFLEKIAREKGYTSLKLAASPEGLAFYEKTGWIKVKEVLMNYLGVDFQETIMEKKL